MHYLTRGCYHLKQISVGDGVDIYDLARDISDYLVVYTLTAFRKELCFLARSGAGVA